MNKINEDLIFGTFRQGIFEVMWPVGKFIESIVSCMKKITKSVARCTFRRIILLLAYITHVEGKVSVLPIGWVFGVFLSIILQ